MLLDFGIVPAMGNNLRRLREDRGWTHEAAANAMGISRGSFIKLERGERKLNEKTIDLAAKAFGVDYAEVIKEANDVPIVGIAGADASFEITFFRHDGELGRAPMPPGGGGSTVAVRVKGDSMRGVAEDNWLIYYDDVRTPLTEDLYGELCILWLADGRVLVKTPLPSRTPGLVHLESTNATTLYDQVVESAALVTAMIPRKVARRLDRV